MRAIHETALYHAAMLKVLNDPKNVRKGSWKRCNPYCLLWCAWCELCELTGAVIALIYHEVRWQRRRDDLSLSAYLDARERVLAGGADYGAFGMMVVDACDCLSAGQLGLWDERDGVHCQDDEYGIFDQGREG